MVLIEATSVIFSLYSIANSKKQKNSRHLFMKIGWPHNYANFNKIKFMPGMTILYH